MSAKTGIEWTEATWNPIAGCTPVSPGCLNCYAAVMAHNRLAPVRQKYRGLTVLNNGRPVFNGELHIDEHALKAPLRTKRPTTFFVNSMSDLFHESLPFEFIDRVFTVMENAQQHTYQILTKRAPRMEEYICWRWGEGRIPAHNIWLGVSVEDQQRADERIPHLLKCPAAVRFLSCEPLLGPIDLGDWLDDETYGAEGGDGPCASIHWVIAGGESGPKARPMHIAWARLIRDHCQAAGVPFFFKQWGAWHPEHGRVVKKRDAGRMLDGREWNEMPARAVEAKR